MKMKFLNNELLKFSMTPYKERKKTAVGAIVMLRRKRCHSAYSRCTILLNYPRNSLMVGGGNTGGFKERQRIDPSGFMSSGFFSIDFACGSILFGGSGGGHIFSCFLN